MPSSLFHIERLAHGRARIYIGKTKVFSYNTKWKEWQIFYPKDKKTLRLAFMQQGGLGDCILLMPLLKNIAEHAPCPVTIDCYSRFPRIFDGLDFVAGSHDIASPEFGRYDAAFHMERFARPAFANSSKIRSLYPKLAEFIERSRELKKKGYDNFQLFNQYALLFGKKRADQGDIFTIFPEKSPFRLPILAETDQVLQKYGLRGKRFILFNRDVDNAHKGQHIKLLSLEKYEQLAALLKAGHPETELVQIGSRKTIKMISGMDAYLLGQTSFEELKILLKEAAFLVSCEGGLVHLSHFIGGKSVVFFGPTPLEVLAYDENINIRGNGCPSTCEWVAKGWADACIRGYKTPPCFDSININNIYIKCKNILQNSH